MYLNALPAFAIVVVGSAYLTISVYVMFNKVLSSLLLLFESNLLSMAFSRFKMADRINPWSRLLKYSKNGGVFYHVKHDEINAFFGGCFQRLAALFSTI